MGNNFSFIVPGGGAQQPTNDQQDSSQSSSDSTHHEVLRQRQQDLERRERLAQLEREGYLDGIKKQELTPKEKESNLLSEMFQVTLNKRTTNKDEIQAYYSVEHLTNELMDPELKKPLINRQNVQDLVIFEVLQSELKDFFITHEERVKYLFECVEKCLEYKEGVDSLISKADIDNIIATCFNYLMTILQQFDGFNISGIVEEKSQDVFDTRNILIEQFCNSLSSSKPSTREEFINRVVEHEEFKFVMNALFKRIYNSLRKSGNLSNSGVFFSAVKILKELLQKEVILNYFLDESPLFYSNTLKFGIQIQNTTILGLLLSLTSFPEEWIDHLTVFQEIKITQNTEQVISKAEGQVKRIRQIFMDLHTQVFSLLQLIARKRADKFIFWVELILEVNKGIVKTYHGHEYCSQPWFLFNFLRILLLFSQILTQGSSNSKTTLESLSLEIITAKTGLFVGSEHIQLFDDARYKTEMVALKDSLAKSEFDSQIFRATMAAIHLNSPLFIRLNQVSHRVAHLTEHFRLNNGIAALGQLMEGHRLKQQQMAYQILLDDEFFNSILLNFFQLEISYSYYLNDFSLEDSNSLSKVSAETTQRYNKLPFFWAEDLAEYSNLFIQFLNSSIFQNKTHIQSIIDFQIILMGFKSWCSNPYFRKRIVEVINSFINSDRKITNNQLHHSPSTLRSFLLSSQIGTKYIIEGLMKLFVEIEKLTEGQTHDHQIQEKLQFRFNYCKILSFLLGSGDNKNTPGIFQEQLKRVIQSENSLFLQFANLYFNDLLLLLGIIQAKMCKIFHLNSQDRPQNQFQLIQRQEEARLSKVMIRQISSNFYSAYQNISLFIEATEDALLQEEVKAKLTNFLNITFFKIFSYHHLDQQAEDDFLSLINWRVSIIMYVCVFFNRLADPVVIKDLNFDVKILINLIVRMFLHLQKYDKFVPALVEDSRVFDVELFRKCIAKFQSLRVASIEECLSFMQLSDKTIEAFEENQRKEALLYAEVPEKYLDPLLNQIMKDPVKLPKSDVVIDRVTIIKHLLNNKTDPFTRDPLQEEDLIALPELKAEIEEFVQQQLQEKKKKQGETENKISQEENSLGEQYFMKSTESGEKQNEGTPQDREVGSGQEEKEIKQEQREQKDEGNEVEDQEEAKKEYEGRQVEREKEEKDKRDEEDKIDGKLLQQQTQTQEQQDEEQKEEQKDQDQKEDDINKQNEENNQVKLENNLEHIQTKTDDQSLIQEETQQIEAKVDQKQNQLQEVNEKPHNPSETA